MVVGVWELVLFLWSHPIISCMVLVLFSPPFYPILVYFSPLLICTGLVVVAMVSMNGGGKVDSDPDWRDSTRYVPDAVLHVDTQLKPVKNGWFQTVKRVEERILAWMPSRLFSFERWQFRKGAKQRLLHQGLSIPVLEVARERVFTDEEADKQKFHEIGAKPSEQSRSRNRSRSHELTSEKGVDDIPDAVTDVPLADVSQNRSLSSPCDLDDLEPYEAQCNSEGQPARNVRGIGSTQGFVPEIVHGEKAINASDNARATSELPHVASKSGSVHGEEKRTAEEEDNGPFPPDAGVVEAIPKGDDNGTVFQESAVESTFRIHVKECSDGVLNETSKMWSLHDRNEFTAKATSKNVEAAGKPLDHDHSSIEDVFMDATSANHEEQTSLAPGTSDLQENLGAYRAGGKLSNHAQEAEEDASLEHDHVKPSRLPERLIASETTIFMDEISAAKSLAAEGKAQPVNANGQRFAVTSNELPHQTTGDDLDERADSRGWELSTHNEPPLSTSKAIIAQGTSAHEPESFDLVESESPKTDWVERSNAEALKSLQARYKQDTLRQHGNSRSVKPDSNIHESDNLNERFASLKSSKGRSTNRPKEANGRRHVELPRGMEDGVRIESPSVRNARSAEGGFVPRTLVFPEKQRRQSVAGNVGFESVEAMTDRLQKKFARNFAKESGIILKAESGSNESTPSSMAAIVPVPSEREKKTSNASGTFTVSPLVNSVISNNGIPAAESVHSKKLLASFLSRRRERPMTPLVEAFSTLKGFDREKDVSSSKEFESGIRIGDRDCDDRLVGASVKEDFAVAVRTQGFTDGPSEESLVEKHGDVDGQGDAEVDNALPTRTETSKPALGRSGGSTTTKGRLIKEKVMSPIKRVFSLDASGVPNKKTDPSKESTPKPSPRKEKQLGKDKSKDRLIKLFSFDGRGTSKLDAVVAEKLSVSNPRLLRKSRSVSASRSKQDGIPKEGGHESPNDMCGVMSSQSHVEERVDDQALKRDLSSEFHTIPASGPLQRENDSEVEALSVNLKAEPESNPESSIDPSTSPPPTSDCRKAPLEGKSRLHKLSVVGAPARITKQREATPSTEKKFALSWTKKKRCSDPLDSAAERLRFTKDKASLNGHTYGEPPRENCISPLRRFHSASIIDTSCDVSHTSMENGGVNDEDESFFLSSSRNRQAPKMSSPSPKKMARDDGNQMILLAEKSKPAEKRAPWWRRHSRGDSTQIQDSAAGSGDEDAREMAATAVTPVKPSGIPFYSWTRRRDSSIDGGSLGINSLRIEDEELTARGNLHSRVRSDSMPAMGCKFSRLRERQPSSLSEAAADLSPSLSGRAASSLNSTSSASARRTDDGMMDDRQQAGSERRNSDIYDSRIDDHYIQRKSNAGSALQSSTTLPSGRPQGLAQDLRTSFHSFGRSDVNVNSLYRKQQQQQPPVAEIRITDKLKMPLEEVLSLLSTGEKEDPNSTTHGTGRGVVANGKVPEEPRQAAAAAAAVVSSSSSEDESPSMSSEDEWSSASDDENEKAPEPQPRMAPLLPPAARIRRKLPHYIFNREEATTV